MPTNAHALSSLLVSERPSLLRLIGRIVNNPSAAEDVAQSLYLRIQTVQEQAPILNARAYLFRLAINLATDHVRSEARRRTVQTEIDELLWLEDDEPSPEQAVLARDALGRVTRAAEALPEPTRTMFRLNRFEGLTQREIAARFDVSSTIVERHIRRALQALDEARGSS